MKKVFISIFLCLISLTLISCEKKTTATKSSPVLESTTTKSQTETNKTTTTMSNDDLTDYYYKEMIKKAKSDKSSAIYFSFDLMKNSTDVYGTAIIGIDLSEDNCGRLIFDLRITKYRQFTPEVYAVLSLKNLENSETEDYLYLTVSKDIFALLKTEKDAIDKDEYKESTEYAELKDTKYAVDMKEILSKKITDYVNVNAGSASSILSTTLRGLLSTVLLSSSRTVGASISNIIRTLSLIGVMDSNGKVDIDRTSDIVKTVIYAIKVKEYEGQTKKIMALNGEISAVVDPIVDEIKENISTVPVVDDELGISFGYELEISNTKVFLDYIGLNYDIESKVSTKIIFNETKATGAYNTVKIQLSAGAVNLISITTYVNRDRDIQIDTDINNYTIVDFSEIKALIETIRQE